MAEIPGAGMGGSLSDLFLQYLDKTNPAWRGDAMNYFNPQSPKYQEGGLPPDSDMLPPGFQMPLMQGIPRPQGVPRQQMTDAGSMGNLVLQRLMQQITTS
jgi:hypothetical protein